VRRSAAFALVALLLALAGGGTDGASAAGPVTLRSILAQPGPDVAFLPGTSDYAVGPIRVSFLIIRNDGKSIEQPEARFWVGRDLDGPAVTSGIAKLEPIGVPGTSQAAAGGARHIYVAQFRLSQPGRYYLVAVPEGVQIQAYRDLDVKKHTTAPNVGDKAIPSRTPTLGTAPIDALTTAEPPDRALLRTSVADAVHHHEPFVLSFATPKYCVSRTCGPTVDVVNAVRRRFLRSDVRFIHVEIYAGNNPANGPNRWVNEWRLPSEPFIFLVGSDGLIKARFEGAVSVDELSAAVAKYLA
jgi:hypothetical protein